MNCGNDCERKKDLKNCLIQLDLLFQWLAAVENKPIEQDGTEMGSNFAKYKIIPEYKEFIQPACEAEEHFSEKKYPQCAERCRNSMQQFIEYLYTQFGWQKPIGHIKPNEPSLDQLITDLKFQDFLKKKGARSHTYSKKYGNDATHEPFYKTNKNDALKCLYDLFYLITKSISSQKPTDEKQLPNPVGGVQRFDPSLLSNHSEELITPQLGIEFVEIETQSDGKEKEKIVSRNILQNVLLEAVLSKEVSESLVKENLSLINKTDALGNTPLSLAVYNEDYNTVKMLLENGADPNFYFKNKIEDFRKSVNDEILKEINQNAPLNDVLKEEYKPILKDNLKGKCESILSGMEEENESILNETEIDKILKKLKDKLEENESILNGTEVDKILEELKSRLEENKSILSRTGIDEILEELKNLLEEYESILSGTENDKILEELKNLLTEKVWCDYFAAHNCIPLIVAIKKDNVDIVELLLKYGAKTWDSCIDDWYSVARIPTECSTLLTCAYFYNAEECIRFLLNKNDIDINRETITGVTPLMLAVENGRNYSKLLKKGARIDSKDNYGNSVFLHAVQNMRDDYELLESLLNKAKDDLNTEELKKLLNHAGHAGCPISYMSEKEAKLYLEYGADVNAKNENGVSCVVDVAYLNPKEMLPWFKKHGAKLDFKTLFYLRSYLTIKYEPRRATTYSKSFFNEVLRTAAKYDLVSPNDLDFSVPIDNIPRITPLIDAILFAKSNPILQDNIDWGKEKSGKGFLTNSQISTLKNTYPFINECSRCGMTFSSYSGIEWWYNKIVEDVKKLPKEKLNISIDMTLEEVFQAVASVKELSKAQRVALFERYPFTKELEKRGIDLNVPEEIESNYNTDWAMSSAEIVAAIKDVKSEIPYEDIEISPLDDALIEKNYDAAAIYLTKGINVSELTKILLLSVHDVPVKDSSTWKKVLVALKLRKDIDFSDVLLSLCKNHPNNDFDIAEEFIDNGYNFYRFANYNVFFWCETRKHDTSNCDYNHLIRNKDGTDNTSPSVEDVRKRNNSLFLKTFGEASFQYVNLRLIKNAILFGANPRKQDEIYKSAFDYAKENRIDESLLKAKPFLQTGVICNIIPDKYDNTKIFRGRIKSNGMLYNFKERLFDNNLQEVAYDDSYKGKAVVFVIQEDSKGPLPGLADLVTLVDI
ncbi:MAG: ankyrin repeat domain-containing protein [Treponema sp.]|nr:ankyrin repeat domain-containing protein [Treponema sp.]